MRVTIKKRTELRRRLVACAALQSGLFTAAQALGAGYSYPAQTYHVARGNWRRIYRGIYRLAEWPVGSHEDLVQWTLWSRGAGVVSHQTALAVHDLGDVNPARIHLTVPPKFRARNERIVLHKGSLPPDDVEKREGYRITTPVRSLLDVARTEVEIDHLARAVEAALRRGITTRRALRSRADAFEHRAALRIERALGQIED